MNMPAVLPKLGGEYRSTSLFECRYYMNICVNMHYSTTNWRWPRWEKEIDWMAMQGINMAVIITASPSTMYRTLKEFGVNENDAEKIKFQEDKIALQQKIVSRMREFGMYPVLHGFSGYVPITLMEKYPNDREQQLAEWPHSKSLFYQRRKEVLASVPYAA